MDFHLTLSCFTFVVSIATLAYVVYLKRQSKTFASMTKVERICAAWNNANLVGTLVAFEAA